MMHTVWCTLYDAYCMMHTVRYILCGAYCMVHTVTSANALANVFTLSVHSSSSRRKVRLVSMSTVGVQYEYEYSMSTV
jgi:hypothetical protein